MGLGDLLKSEKAQDLLDKGLDLVKEHATEEGIEALIAKCKEMGLTDEQIMQRYGISKSTLIFCFAPKPLHSVQAPYGALNENNLGSNSGKEKSHSGQA